jgi:ribosomal protein S18 acetylase RimI-like enzyme
MPIRVRRATAADTDALITLLDDGRHEIGIDAHIDLRSPEYRANFERWCCETDTVQVWLTTDRAGALVLLNHGTVQYIAVAANRRHEGIGRKLLTHPQKLCDQLDAEVLNTNINSQRLLLSCGFIHLGEKIKKGRIWFDYHWCRREYGASN